MNWMDIVKVKQIVTPTTKISNRQEPREENEDDKCCQEAIDRYVETYLRRNPETTFDVRQNIGDGSSYDACKKFRRYLQNHHDGDGPYTHIIDIWRRCEDEYIYG